MTEKSKRPAGGVLEMAAIALPMVVSYACDTVMMFCDRLLLSRLGPDLMNAAVGGGSAAFLIVSCGFGLIGYSTALVAQYFGANQKKFCSRVTAQAFIAAACLFPLILLSRPLVHKLFYALHVPPAQIEAQIVFFDILAYGAILLMLRQSMACFFSGIGRTGIVMTAALLAMVMNVAVSWILIYGKLGMPALGIRGAAIGNISGTLSAVILLASFYFGKKNAAEFFTHTNLVFDSVIMKKFLRFGSPTGVEMFLSILAFNGFIMAFHAMGPVTATAASIVINWDMVAYVPLMGMEVGVTSLVGRYIGAQTLDTAHRSVLSGLKVGGVYSMLLLVLFGFFPGPLAHLFHPAGASVTFAEAQPIAVAMLRMIAVYVFSIVIVIVYVGALRGAGDTLWAMSYHISLHWICVIVLYSATRFFHASAPQGWAAVIAAFLMLSLIAWRRYSSGKWKNIHMIGLEGA